MMKTIFKKAIAGFTSLALVATLLIGVNITKASADDESVSLGLWTFTQGGDYTLEGETYEGSNGNYASINSVTMSDTSETLTGWITGIGNVDSINQAQTATQVSTGFALDILNTGWDADWENLTFNPWSIQASMGSVEIEAGHIYTVSFDAYATTTKYCYVDFGCEVDGVSMAPYDADTPTGSNQIIAIKTSSQTFTYTFTNWVSAKEFSTTLMLGAFTYQKDYAGNDVSDIITSPQTNWSGTVYVSNFTITDNGLNSSFVAGDTDEPEAITTASAEETTTVSGSSNNSTTTVSSDNSSTTSKLAKVKKVKAKNNKAGKIKITWKKVANANKYKVKVGKKTYKTSKNKYTVKVTKGKTYTVKVRAMKANGYKAGAWSKKVKVKVKK